MLVWGGGAEGLCPNSQKSASSYSLGNVFLGKVIGKVTPSSTFENFVYVSKFSSVCILFIYLFTVFLITCACLEISVVLCSFFDLFNLICACVEFFVVLFPFFNFILFFA